MSAHELSFPYEARRNRDLSDAELWQRSLRRSVHRREITEAARKHAMRRKSAAVAVTASMAAGPVASPIAAVASVGSGSAVATQKAGGGGAGGSAIALPSGALVDYGDTGEAVAAVQQVVGVDNDGIFGPITQGGVKRWQAANGLPATGAVDAKTWTKMFQSSVSYVGKDGKTTVTVNDKSGSKPSTGVDGPAPTTTKPRVKQPGSKRSEVAEKNRNAVTKPQSVTKDQTVQAPAAETAPAPAPATTGAGCGAGRIASPVSGTTTGVYGENRGSHAHAGKDIAAPTGTAVRAAQCGTVTKAGMDGSGYGNLVCIEHEGGVSTCYAHLSQINTKVGSYVHVGDVIGKVGCTGSCTGPHLHFEVRENGKTVNPENYLSGSKTIAGAAPKTSSGTGKLAVTTASSDAAWGEATAATSAETEATLAAAYTAAATASAPTAVAATGTTDPAATGAVAPATEAATANGATTDGSAGEAAPTETAPATTGAAANGEAAPGTTGAVAPATEASTGSANGAVTEEPAGEAAPAEAPAASAPAEAQAETAPAPAAEAPAPVAEAPAETAPAPAAEAPAPAPATESTPAPVAETPAAPVDAAPAEETGATVAPTE